MWAINFRRIGFTLIELLVSIAVIAIVSSVGLFISARTNLERARDGRRQADLESIRSALEIYRSDIGYYPSGRGEASGLLDNQLAPTYMTAVPKDPSDPTYTYFYGGLGAVSSCDNVTDMCVRYALCARLEKVAGNGVCGIDPGDNACNFGQNGCNYRTENP